MFELDRITDYGKQGIVRLLNEIMQVEYGNIINYPRYIDQLENTNVKASKSSIDGLETLGKDSVRHLGLVVEFIKRLGGQPNWGFNPTERITDIRAMLSQQMQKENASLSLFMQAIKLAEQNQLKGLSAMGDVIKIARKRANNDVERSTVIAGLGEFAKDELRHIELLRGTITNLDL